MVDVTQDSKILELDYKIRNILQDEINNLDNYIEKYSCINSLLDIKDLSKSSIEKVKSMLQQLTDKIENAKTQQRLDYYILETSEIINKYKDILQTPITISFTGKSSEDTNMAVKTELVNSYMKIAKKYIDNIDIITLFASGTNVKNSPISKKPIRYQCPECKKKIFDIVDNTTYICIECGTQQEIPSSTISFKDIDRVNISAKFTYERLIHFRDCIKQYQGKQNTTIDQTVYDDLEKQFELHHLLVGDKNTPRKERFKNITKDHISIFLKDLRYTRHYENINLIHYNLTEVQPDDISHLENKLMDDFIILTEMYNKYKQEKKISRKSFINSQYVLYQLLNRHKHHCKKEDFNILKTIDRQYFHDEVTKDLFQELGWNMVFLF